MKIYLSSFTTDSLISYLKIFPDDKLDILLSYGLRNSNFTELIETYRASINSLMLDSGTFTLNFAPSNSGNITFKGFYDYVDQFYDKFDYIFAYDRYFEEDSWKLNLYYLDIMEKYGYNVVPVVHSYSKDELDEYINRGYKIVALGYSKFKVLDYIYACSKYLNSYGIKTHLLGGSKFKILSQCPINSCDTSSWTQYSNYGNVKYKDKNSKWNLYNFTDFERQKTNYSKNNKTQFKNYVQYITNGKLCYADLAAKDSIYRKVLNIKYFKLLAQDITYEHAKHGYKIKEL